MIKKKEYETLINVRGNANVNLNTLVTRAENISSRWRDTIAVGNNKVAVRLTPDASVAYTDCFGREYRSDVSEYAFSQLCSKAGIPASFIMKCLETDRQELALMNYESFANELVDDQFLVRKYTDEQGNDTVRAILTDKYNVFDSGLVMNSIAEAVDLPQYRGRYEANQAFLNEDHLHVRFVDFNNPLPIGNDKLYSGFTVSSSDVGSGALCIKYFVYRFACRNGLVIAQGGGTMFRQTHLRQFELDGLNLFSNALEMIDTLNERVVQQITAAQNKKLDQDALDMYLAKAQTKLHIGKKGREQLAEILNTSYDMTKWGVINAITENSQSYTLEDRINAETFAGALLVAA